MPKLSQPPLVGTAGNRRELEPIDQRIAECIIRQPKVTVEQLADELSLSPSTIQKHLSELFEGRHIERVIAVRDWAGAGFPLRARVDIRVNMRELKAGRGGLPDDEQKVDSQKKLAQYIAEIVPKQFRGRLVVEDVAILLGHDADLSLTIRVKDQKVVLDFVTEGLRMLGGVDATMTSFESWSYGEP